MEIYIGPSPTTARARSATAVTPMRTKSSPVHQAARAVLPAARIAYVDIDPVVLSHARALLATSDGVTAVAADLRDPAAVLAHPELRAVIDPARPVGDHPRRGPALPRRRCRPGGDRRIRAADGAGQLPGHLGGVL